MTNPTDSIDPLLSKKRVADAFGVTTRTIDIWVEKGRFPAPVRTPSNRPSWHKSVIEAALQRSANAA